jgi:hypothetical protein
MEPQNHKLVRCFLNSESRKEVIKYVDSIHEDVVLNDHHLKHLLSKLNGMSYMYDISKTLLTGKLCEFQSGGYVVKQELPEVFHHLVSEIADLIGLPKDNVFLQIVDMNDGGTIGKHYDASYEGYINYKCNVSVMSEDYDFCIDDTIVHISECDMYTFEASLYKHWTVKPFTGRRILLSFGFLVPYEMLGRSGDDPRVRLSKRIEKYFQS